MPSRLADLVAQQPDEAVSAILSRVVDRVAEALMDELLRDPEVRRKLGALIEAACTKALADLQAEIPPTP